MGPGALLPIIVVLVAVIVLYKLVRIVPQGVEVLGVRYHGPRNKSGVTAGN